MKNSIITLLSVTILITACSSIGTHQNNDLNAPPHDFKQIESSAIIHPQPNKNTPQSLVKFESQNSQYVPFTRAEETRGYGGNVSVIKINNRGRIPDYYIFPNQQPDSNVNNKQLNISAPTWQLHW
jgi:hypothetical protein